MQYADDAWQALQRALRELPATRHAVIMGHGMGGAVAVLAASRHGGISGVVSAEGNLVAADCGPAALWRQLPSRAYLHGDAAGISHLASVLDPAEVTVIPGAGHFMMTDNPGGFYEAVARATSRVTRK